MLKGDLTTDSYCTERVTMLIEKIITFLRRATLEGVPDVRWIDSIQIGTFTLLEVMVWVDEIRSASLSCCHGRYITPLMTSTSLRIIEKRAT